MNKDLEIASSANMLEINDIASKLSIDDKYIENYGKYKAYQQWNYYIKFFTLCLHLLSPLSEPIGLCPLDIFVIDYFGRVCFQQSVSCRL